MPTKYRPLGSNLKFIGVATHFLNGELHNALGGKVKGCCFPRYENQRLKARLEDTVIDIISETLEGNELRPEYWRERVKRFGHVKSLLKRLAVLTDAAYERGYITDDEAGKWQGVIDDLSGKMGGLINAALPGEKGKP